MLHKWEYLTISADPMAYVPGCRVFKLKNGEKAINGWTLLSKFDLPCCQTIVAYIPWDYSYFFANEKDNSLSLSLMSPLWLQFFSLWVLIFRLPFFPFFLILFRGFLFLFCGSWLVLLYCFDSILFWFGHGFHCFRLSFLFLFPSSSFIFFLVLIYFVPFNLC